MVLKKFLHRVDQFRRAVFSKVDEKEIIEISSVLSDEEISLFLQMSIVDQRHSLDVYYTSLEVLKEYPEADPILSKKAVLLHDLGKSRFTISLFDRVLATFPRRVVGILFPWKLKHVFDYKYLHPEYSARMVIDDRIRAWVRVHYEAVNDADPPELKVLKISDSLN